MSANPYAVLKNGKAPSQLPQLDKKDQAKMGKSMQRRMSVHYTDDANLRGLTGPIPPLPTTLLDEQHGSSKSVSTQKSQVPSVATMFNQDSPQRLPKTKDIMNLHDPHVLKMLGDPDFNAEAFITARLADATASDIEKFNVQLSNLNGKVLSDVKASAMQTYERLKGASKELSIATSELKFLRNAINELAEITTQMKESADKTVQLELELQDELTKSNSKKKSRAKDRSSILVLEKMWASEMNSLFKHVEGAQKYISAIPGRHVIAESGRWYELNAATFKTLQPAHIFLLNDLILIATRKRKVQKQHLETQQQALVAAQCWPLREVHLSELKPQMSEKQTYAINITYNSLSYIYQTDRLDHYKKITEGYLKARNELRDISEAENIKQKQLRDSMNLLALSENGSSQNGKRYSHSRNSQMILQDLSTRMHSRSRSLDNSNVLRLLKSIDNQVDDIDMKIFHEHHEDAVMSLQDLSSDLSTLKAKCNKDEQMLYNIINMKIASKNDEILKQLIKHMRQTGLSSSQIEKPIIALTRLGQADVAKTLFLHNRSLSFESLMSKVPQERTMDGKLKTSDYIVALSIVKFHNIKTTIELYKRLFVGQYQSQSYLVAWGIDEVQSHIKMLQDTVQNVKFTGAQLKSSILVIHRQVQALKESGLDVEYLLDEFYRSIDTE
jgi:hypothetical protein